MNKQQIQQAVEWIERHWPHAKIDFLQLDTLVEQLAPFDPLDVFAALQELFEEGRDFPPNPSVLVAKAREIKQEADEWEGSHRPVLPVEREVTPVENQEALGRYLTSVGAGSLLEAAKMTIRKEN